MIDLLLFVPIILSILLVFISNKNVHIACLVLYAAFHLIVGVGSCFFNLKIATYLPFLAPYFKLDSLGSLFLLNISVIFAGVAFYNIGFLKDPTREWRKLYPIFLLMFVFSIDGLILSQNLGLFWVFIEATTLSSAVLICHDRSKAALEATWKYIFICSIGIALAFVGILLLLAAYGEGGNLFFSYLYGNAKGASVFWLKLSFIFMLIGFGTKMGLVPVHSWLPDAHAEAPSPISAMLSGALLNTAFLGILRAYKVLEIAGKGDFARGLFILMGIMSICIGAVYIIKVRNFKRLLAYSSIEHMGIMVLGVGIGGLGLFASLLHMMAHSFSKASLFLTSGNILHSYKTKSIDQVKGLFKRDYYTGWLWMIGLLAITAFPPFGTFISEFYLIKAMFKDGHFFLAAFVLFFLTVVLYGMAHAFFVMLFGEDVKDNLEHHKASFTAYLPQTVFLLAVLFLGVFIPKPFWDIIQNACAYIK